MTIYDSEWEDKPIGYYADNRVKTRHDKRMKEEMKWANLVSEKLEEMGIGPDELPTSEQIQEAEKAAREEF